MDIAWARDGTVHLKLLLGLCGVILAVVAFVLSSRAEKLVGVPVMTGYGSDHERAMMEGALKVIVTTTISLSTH